MTNEEEQSQEIAEERARPRAGEARLIAITALIIIAFTGVIAYGVHVQLGGGDEWAEGVLVDGVKEFRIPAAQWEYKPSTIKVDPGDTIRLIVTSQDITHGFAINELDINLALSSGKDIVREVVIPPDIPEGTYTMYCSVFCGIGHPYMKGSFIIGEPGFEIGKVLPYVATSLMAGGFAGFIFIGRRRAG